MSYSIKYIVKYSDGEIKEYIEEQAPSRADHKKMRDFTYHHVQNTEKDHPTIKRMFIKKFGSHNVKHFDRHVSALVDQYDPEAKKMVK